MVIGAKSYVKDERNAIYVTAAINMWFDQERWIEVIAVVVVAVGISNEVSIRTSKGDFCHTWMVP